MRVPRRIAPALLAAATVAAAQGPARRLDLLQMMERIADQAEAFRRAAPTTLSEETLDQRSRKPGTPEQYDTREVISEYGYASLPNAPNAIHEVRKVISVDGKQVTPVAKARQAMSLGIKSADDKLKKRLLEEFEKYGLRGAVTDFGQVILLFSAPRQHDYKFEITGEQLLGADRVVNIGYRQVSGSEGVTVFRTNNALRQTLKGEILARKTDGLPLRITMNVVQPALEGAIRDESSVDYAESPFGCVLPVSVVHREYYKEELISENVFRYASFRKIDAGVSLKIPDALREKD